MGGKDGFQKRPVRGDLGVVRGAGRKVKRTGGFYQKRRKGGRVFLSGSEKSFGGKKKTRWA